MDVDRWFSTNVKRFSDTIFEHFIDIQKGNKGYYNNFWNSIPRQNWQSDWLIASNIKQQQQQSHQ